MTSSFAKRKGFTLIEIMIVVAVLAILVTTVVVAQKATVTRSKNSRILSAISDVRKIAETIYMSEGTGYINLCDTPPSVRLNARYRDLDNLGQDIEENGGQVFCHSIQNSYCISAKLFDGQNFCIDDESHFGSTDIQVCINAESECP